MVEALLASDGTPRALVLTGGPGVGKTSLWEAGVEAATGRGLRVLRASGSGAETQLSFAALIDLLDGIDLDAIDGLPTPQRQALEVALYRAEAASPPDPSALALGLLSTLRSLAAVQPVLVAVDDLQWLDETSADALAFAARRLDTEPIAFLLARRPGPSSTLERALGTRPVEHRGGDALDRRDAPDAVRAARALGAAPRPAPRLRDDARQPALLARGRADDRRQR